MNEVRIGILALQGDFEAHRKMLEERLCIETELVRMPCDLRGIDALILPGGESTTIGKLMNRVGLDVAIRDHASNGMPIYGTCAGLILMANEIEGSDQLKLAIMDATVARNAFGRQLDSFEADIPMPIFGDAPIRGVFIRAPYVTNVGADVEIIGRFRDLIVAVRQGNLIGTAFHPELTDDTRLHQLLVQMSRDYAGNAKP